MFYANLERARLRQERKADGLKPSWFEHFVHAMDPDVKRIDNDSDALADQAEKQHSMSDLDREKQNAHRMLKVLLNLLRPTASFDLTHYLFDFRPQPG